MTTLREAAQQALDAMNSFESGANGLYQGEFAEEIAALKAALAETSTNQCGETCERAKLCAVCARVLAVGDNLSPGEPVQEPVDVGNLEYRGNSVGYIYQKMTAYRNGIDAAWDALRAKGIHPDGKTRLAEAIARHTSPPQRPAEPATIAEWWADKQRKPLTDHEIDALELPPSGEATVRDFVRLVERAHGIK